MLKFSVISSVLFLLASAGLSALDVVNKSIPGGAEVWTTIPMNKTNEMIKAAGGSFQMGPQSVNISAFSISKYDIMQGEWIAVMKKNPSCFSNDLNNPVECVSWYDALVYCNKRSIKEKLVPVYSIGGSTDPSKWGAVPTLPGSSWNNVTANWSANGYRLPTEMEWMWAAMGGDTNGYSKAFAGSTGSNNFSNYAWALENDGTNTRPVGSKLSNELGLYDMNGNVYQWCWDWYRDFTSGTLTNYRGLSNGAARVLRGGSWGNSSAFANIAHRFGTNPYYKNNFIGLRVARHEKQNQPN